VLSRGRTNESLNSMRQIAHEARFHRKLGAAVKYSSRILSITDSDSLPSSGMIIVGFCIACRPMQMRMFHRICEE